MPWLAEKKCEVTIFTIKRDAIRAARLPGRPNKKKETVKR